ncbi:hypothetical protein DFH08DRAFT_818549 [Mycena albidolilacea]|uniref:Uncharacterized protein n=1 Tax=Mycena albidolilacea TaxID=1033008 RepID=A0AAD7EFX5_9AGAR|nr:hypothetical protein DFH08DRAFT_818549 [Mycena albidolilacea]
MSGILAHIHYVPPSARLSLPSNLSTPHLLQGDLLKAVELWNTARPLFEQSSQAKEVQCVDERLACVGSDVLEQHRENIARLVEFNVPSSNPSSIKHEEQVKLVDEPLKQGVV